MDARGRIIKQEQEEVEAMAPVTVQQEEEPEKPIMSLELLREIVEQTLAGKSGQWSVYVKHLPTGAELEYNNQPMQPASVIKLFRMVALYRAAQQEKVELTSYLLDLAKQMITVSANAASNEIVAILGEGDFQVGAQWVDETAAALGCTDTQDGMMLFDYDPDFLVSGNNLTTVKDCGLVLEKIYRKECVSPEYDQEMLYLLLGQTRREKIPALLPKGTWVANKTGETDDIQADVGIVFSPGGDFVICVIVNQTFDGLESQQTIAQLSERIYSYFNETGVQ